MPDPNQTVFTFGEFSMVWALRSGRTLRVDDALKLLLQAFWEGEFPDDQFRSNSHALSALYDEEVISDTEANSVKNDLLSFVPEGDKSRYAAFDLLIAVDDPIAKALHDNRSYDWDTRFAKLANTPIDRYGEDGQIILKDALAITQSGLIEWLERRGYREVIERLFRDGKTEFAAPDESTSQESPEEKEAASNVAYKSNLKNDHRSKGGSRPKYDRGLQEFIDRLAAELKGKGEPLTLSALETRLSTNAPEGEGYESGISDCDEIEIHDDRVCWIDSEGAPKSLALKSIERYVRRANNRPSQKTV